MLDELLTGLLHWAIECCVARVVGPPGAVHPRVTGRRVRRLSINDR